MTGKPGVLVYEHDGLVVLLEVLHTGNVLVHLAELHSCRPLLSSRQSLEHPKPQVGDLTGARDEYPLGPDLTEFWRVDESNSVAEQDRHEVDNVVVEQTST